MTVADLAPVSQRLNPPRRRLIRWQLGLACLFLGAVWAAGVLALGLTSMRGRGARSPTALLALPCAVGVLSCGVLVLACFPSLTRRLRLLGWLAVAAGTILTLAVAWSGWDGSPETLRPFLNPGDAQNPSNLAIAASLVMLTCSAGLIVTRWLSGQASRHQFRPLGAVQAVFQLFWRQHQLVGWMALALAGAHSVYFLRYPRGFQEQWTGIVALALLGALGLIGLFTSYRARLALWVHRATAIALAVVLTLHWPPILYAEVGAVLVLALTALVNLKAANLVLDVVLARNPAS